MQNTPLSSSILQDVLRIGSQFFRRKTKSDGLLKLGTAPYLTINRVSSFNFSSVCSNSPKDLTLDSIQKEFFGVFQLLFKKPVEIMETAVRMSCIKNKQTCNIIMIFICIISQSMKVKCQEDLKFFIVTKMSTMCCGTGSPTPYVLLI